MQVKDTTPRDPRRIAVIVPKYGTVGGGERFTSEVTERLSRNHNFEIHVFASRWVANSKRIRFHKVPAIPFMRLLGALLYIWSVKRMIRRKNFDLVHTHHWAINADVFSVHGIPHVSWVRDVLKKRPSLYDRVVIAIERRTMKAGGSSFCHTVSSIAMEAFRREYDALPGQWEIIHPGVDVERFASPDRNACRAEIRQRFGIGADDLLVLFVGMNFEVKGLDTIIRAVARARAARPDANIRLLVVGRGNEKKFGDIARSLGIADAVIFAGTQHKGLERFYRAADVFTMLSAFDTFGMVVLEAMAAGLPVIVSPNVGAKDLVAEGSNGFILPDFRDADAAADRMIQLLAPERRKAMGAAAQAEAEKHTWDRLAEKMEHVYQGILSRKSRTPT